MKRLILIFVTGLILFNYKQTIGQTKKEQNKIEFNQGLADELKAMAEIDQIAAYVRQGKYKDWTIERWSNFKDSVFTTHKKRLEEYLINSDTPDTVWLENLAHKTFG